MELLRVAYANRWARYTVTLAVLALVVARINPAHLVTAFHSAKTGYVLAALALTVPFLYLKVLRWYLLLRYAGVEASLGDATVSLMGGMGLALLTPARLGELVRVAYISDPRKWKIGGLVMIDKAFDVLVLTGLSVAGAWYVFGPVVGAGFAIATLIGLAIVYFPTRLHTALHAVSSGFPLRQKLESLWSSLESLSPRSATVFLALTILAFAVVLLQFAIILLSWHSWSLDVVILTFPLVVLTNVLPITIGGLGIREGTAVLLLAHFGVPAADAALAAFLMFALNTALPGVIGAIMLPSGQRQAASHPAHSLPHR